MSQQAANSQANNLNKAQAVQQQPQQVVKQQEEEQEEATHHHANSESVRFAPESDNEEKPVCDHKRVFYSHRVFNLFVVVRKNCIVFLNLLLKN